MQLMKISAEAISENGPPRAVSARSHSRIEESGTPAARQKIHCTRTASTQSADDKDTGRLTVVVDVDGGHETSCDSIYYGGLR